jgi:hypothetical protein
MRDGCRNTFRSMVSDGAGQSGSVGGATGVTGVTGVAATAARSLKPAVTPVITPFVIVKAEENQNITPATAITQ